MKRMGLFNEIRQNRGNGTNKDLVTLKETGPSFSIDAICSTYLNNNFMLYGRLLIYGVGLSPEPLPYYRLNH